jgi:L-alanine-DL-glutamate epimerase-like enolase superfamily enzyme
MTHGVRYRARPLGVPFSRTISSPTYRFTKLFTVLCEAEDGDGVKGCSGLWFASEGQSKVAFEALRYLAPIASAHDSPDAVSRAVRREINFLGYKGVTVIAMSAFEMALQDLSLRREDRALGNSTACPRVPAYWSGFFLNDSVEDWIAEADTASQAGFWAFKARVGRPTLAEDVQRVQRLREALPPQSTLMLDAHQIWDVDTAVEASALLEPAGITWLEDPVIHNDYRGLAEVVSRSAIPIASGENEYLHEGFAQLMDSELPYLLVDLERAGGINEWAAIADDAKARERIVTPHLFPHVAVGLCSHLQQDESWLEYVDWWDPLMATPIDFNGGYATVPDMPGTGFAPDDLAIERFALAPWEELHDARHQRTN